MSLSSSLAVCLELVPSGRIQISRRPGVDASARWLLALCRRSVADFFSAASYYVIS